ncbi:outer membrane lipoprotein-sorting protein [Gilvibacter sediminis]|uniref:outer membrane lipoprotein-sorting protein n=1 Tax=Gilvibacter sediminis TaxID=379071 RepID=UPI0023509220|nr:outer membrane lipoprotein-sorting protein [Gilvibacter sediminis]MDC7998333.1 outer membrane lipoprotein-sorting protein [Gilvibacter sediminis]
MKILKTLSILLVMALAVPAQAQTVDEILNNYFENTGGADAWNNLESLEMTAMANAQGMEIPVTMIQTKEGKMMLKINFQGQEIVQQAYDGETLWSTNFMTQQPEKADAETTANMKLQTEDFPSPFLNYKEKGFTVELLGEEVKEGTDCYKIKLTQKPRMVDGKEVPNVSFYYFEKENFVPIMSEVEIPSGPMAGQMSVSTMSDYQEVDGLYFPFDMGMGGQAIMIKDIKLNPDLDDSMFVFPGDADGEEDKD